MAEHPCDRHHIAGTRARAGDRGTALQVAKRGRGDRDEIGLGDITADDRRSTARALGGQASHEFFGPAHR